MAKQMSKRAATMERNRLNKEIARLRGDSKRPMPPEEREAVFAEIAAMSAKLPALTAIIGDGGVVSTDSLIA